MAELRARRWCSGKPEGRRKLVEAGQIDPMNSQLQHGAATNTVAPKESIAPNRDEGVALPMRVLVTSPKACAASNPLAACTSSK
jgi:hypothetical protein